MPTGLKILLGIIATVFVSGLLLAPTEAGAEATGTLIGYILLIAGIGFVVLRRAR